MKSLAIVSAFFLAQIAPAHAASLVSSTEVPLCKWLNDLRELVDRLKAKDDAGAAPYLLGTEPACLILEKGETVEQLDQNGPHIQVVTRHGLPRFIGWGDRASFNMP